MLLVRSSHIATYLFDLILVTGLAPTEGRAEDRMTTPSELIAVRRLAAAATIEGPDKLFNRETNALRRLGKGGQRNG